MEIPADLSQGINVEGAPLDCSVCGAALCIRKQVINLALGNTEIMKCLLCLGQESGQGAEGVLLGLKGYIRGRECFRKPWDRYRTVEYCPDRQGCFPSSCFEA